MFSGTEVQQGYIGVSSGEGTTKRKANLRQMQSDTTTSPGHDHMRESTTQAEAGLVRDTYRRR